jgi:hypothetical protein
MNDSHQRQQSDAIAASLTIAGIGRAYHKRTLAELADGAMLKTWLTEHARDEIGSGKGWTVTGPGAAAYDATVLLARAIHLSGRKVRLTTLRRLTVQVMEQGDLLDDYTTCQCLVVTEFFQHYPGNPLPLTGREVQAVESFLLERLDDMGAVCVQSAKKLGNDTWWSPALIQRLNGLNRTLEVV